MVNFVSGAVFSLTLARSPVESTSCRMGTGENDFLKLFPGLARYILPEKRGKKENYHLFFKKHLNKI